MTDVAMITAIQQTLARELPDRTVRDIGTIARRIAAAITAERCAAKEDPW